MAVVGAPATHRDPRTRYEVYGLTLGVTIEMASHLRPTEAAPDVVFELLTTPPLPEHAWGRPLRERSGEFALHRVDDVDVLDFTDEATFFLTDRWIGCCVKRGAPPEIAEIRLLGSVLAYWLESYGIPTLHASAVVVDGKAAVFAAGNGSGKSALAAELMLRGNPLLTDDILAIDVRGGVPYGRPGYPQMRMWPDEARRYVGDVRGLTVVHPSFDKLRVPVGEEGLGTFSATAAELGTLYLLDPTDTDEEPVFEPVDRMASVVHVAGWGFAAPVASAGRHQQDRFTRLAAIADRVPVWWLTYGRRAEERGSLVNAVLTHLRTAARPGGGDR